MKTKLSVTLDEGLVSFVDGEPGKSRSDKIESILRRVREARRDAQLRRELAAFHASQEDDDESDAWRMLMENMLWNESGEATSGPSRSRRSRNRGRR